MESSPEIYELRLDKITLLRYTLGFKGTVVIGGGSVEQRQGLLIGLRSGSHIAWTEASPLPGFSQESLQEIEEALISWSESLRLHPQVLRLTGTGDIVNTGLKPLPSHPALHFGLSSALVSLITQKLRISHAELWGLDHRAAIPVNALIDGPPLSWLQQGRERMTQDYRSLKVKVGRQEIKNELAGVFSLARKLRKDISLRLDANRAWSFEEACDFCQQIEPLNIEYIEEPLRDPAGLERLHAETGIPIALDETLQQAFRPENRYKVPESGIAAWILKPTLLGDLTLLTSMADMARRRDVKCVLTSSFESDIGVRVLAELSSVLSPGMTCGLGTLRYFQDHLTSDSEVLDQPVIQLSNLSLEPSLDKTHVAKVYSW